MLQKAKQLVAEKEHENKLEVARAALFHRIQEDTRKASEEELQNNIFETT